MSSPATNSSSIESWTTPGAGITGGYDGDSEILRIFIVFFAGLACYNAVELVIMVLLTFSRWRGLYFWSLLISGIGIIPYALGFLLKFMNITTGNLRWLAVTLLTIGWYPMITGQAVVLWSRLHLLVHGESGEKVLRWTMWMIIVDAIVLHIPTTVLTVGSNSGVDTGVFVPGYNIMEKIQMIGFFAQEVILSSIYIFETVKLLRGSLQPRTRVVMHQLIAINAVIIAMDLGLLGLECASLYILETLVKGVVYSIKLKLEFAILGKLVVFVGGNQPGQTTREASVAYVTTQGKHDGGLDVSDFVDLSRAQTDYTQPSLGSVGHSDRHASVHKIAGDVFDMARFEHVEDIATLDEDEDGHLRSRASSSNSGRAQEDGKV